MKEDFEAWIVIVNDIPVFSKLLKTEIGQKLFENKEHNYNDLEDDEQFYCKIAYKFEKKRTC